jgi:Ca2+-binding EF-hand superfamily protein
MTAFFRNWQLQIAIAFSLALLLGAISANAADTPKAEAPKEVAVDDDDVHDLVFMSDARPILIRLHVRIDGKRYGAAFDNYLAELFDFLDRDRDGVLSRDEADRAPSGPQLLQMRQNGYTFGIGGAGTFATFSELDEDSDEEVTLEEFRNYYHRTAPSLQLVVNPSVRGAGNDALTDTLFRLLDKNRDGKLSKEELSQAEKVLRAYDANDDELVSATELSIASGTQVAALDGFGGDMMMNRKNPRNEPSAFFLIPPGDPAARLNFAQKVVAYYDKNGDGKLSRTEIDLPADVFKELDLNKDGELSPVEIMRMLRRPPDLEYVVRLGKLSDKESPTDAVGKPAPLAKYAKGGTAGNILLALGDSQLDLRRVESGYGSNDQLAAAAAGVRQQYVSFLKMADTKGKGYIEKEDITKPQYRQVQTLFDLADRDGDGKLTEAELNAYFEMQAKAVGSYISISVTDNGRGLFDILDANRDGSLGLRELRTAWTRLAPYDRNGDGCISREEIPRQFQVMIGLGQATQFGQRPAQPAMGAPPTVGTTNRGPIWFRKMDRNGDGDVSLREFLGTREQFDKIDTDGDGLISLEEAERYDEKMRKEKK